MRDRYLEVTFRNGRALAAYLHLPRGTGVTSARSAEVAPGVVADYASDGALIGLEFTAPRRLTAETLARVDQVLGAAGVTGATAREELAPLAAA